MPTATSHAVSPWPQIIREALSKPSGSRFYRCALQVNPHHYADTFRGKAGALSESQYVEEIIRQAQANEISVLAIADHNHVGSVERFRAEAAKANIHIFPGFEIASSEGVHVLCLYPLDATIAQLERCLGELGIRNTTPSSDLSNKNFAEILEAVSKHGGITIAAHVTESKGLLHTLQGTARIHT